jgi:cobalt/nickel transport system permease protein
MLLSALILVVGIVIGMPHSLLEIACILALTIMVALLTKASILKLLLRSLIVLPFAGSMALLAPLRYLPEISLTGLSTAYFLGLPLLLQLVLTPWLCVLVMLVLAQACSQSDLLYAMERLRLPRAFLLLLTFLYRYVDLMRSQLASLRRSLVSRAPQLSRRRQVLLYGNLAGSLIVRAQTRGERIHVAMLARGFTGSLPRRVRQRFGVADALLVATMLALALAFSFI